MKYTLVWSSHFSRTARKFLKKHPDLRNRFTPVLKDLEDDPFQPHLKLHQLKGKLSGLYGVSITHGYRMTLMLDAERSEVVLLDVGSHDDVYR